MSDGFVRIYIGQDPQKKVPVYRLCQVMEIVPWHKIYTIGENTSCNQALKLKHGKAEKIFTMDIISNQPITQVFITDVKKRKHAYSLSFIARILSLYSHIRA